MTDEEKIRAMRCARHVVSDIVAYNRQKIIKGVEQDNLFEHLRDELTEGREHYKNRVSAEIYQNTNYFDRAIVDVMVKPMERIKSNMW
ncbi:MAG: hypothetical protein FWG75_05275 [Cystobacterineae bacterium]|nr:hypothetical protein [Cystobacterineae bacterium]